jgi:hypothetical protein
MRLMFAYHLLALQAGTVGSAGDIHRYAQAAKALGHELVVYGPPDPGSPFTFSLDVEAADALIFVFEWTTELRRGDHLDFARFVARVPRNRRIVIDCDGSYNDVITVNGDSNHRDAASSWNWIAACDSLSDKICQPTLHPIRRNVRPFLFYGYSPVAIPTESGAQKEFGMVYVGHSKFRWGPMERVLRATERNSQMVGRIAFVGHGWDALPPWASSMGMEQAFYTDQAYLRKRNVEIVPPVRFEEVVPWMSRAVFSPVLLRPTFKRLQFVTPRFFETLTATTIPLFDVDRDVVREVYGDRATELLLPLASPEEKILDVFQRLDYYTAIVEGIRGHLADRHTHIQRLQELIDIVES